MDDKRGEHKVLKQKSKIWKNFDIANARDRTATCNICFKLLSYKSSLTNLRKHLERRHADSVDMIPKLSDDEEGSVEELETYLKDEVEVSDKRKSSSGAKKRSAAWEFFVVKDATRRIASCKLCDSTCSYMSSVSNLMKHARRKHSVRCDDDYASNNNATRQEFNKRSPIWLYFKCIDNVAKISVCLICKSQLSYLTSTSNLKRHLYRKHPWVKLKDNTNGKKMLIGSDGQLYDIDDAGKTVTQDVDDDDQTEPMELNAIYLDEYEGNLIKTKCTRKSSSSKRKRLRDSGNNGSSDDEVPFQKRYVKEKNDSLDQFGKYLVSLLKQLPKELSNQLQADFVKQVMTAQLSYDSQKVVVTPSNGYARRYNDNGDAAQ